MNNDLNKLAKILQSGEIAVFDDIYYQTKNIVFYTIKSILHDNSLSEDIMQETYLRMINKIHQYKRNQSFRAWIIMIARNLAINEYNRRKKEILIDISENEYLLGSTEDKSEKEVLITQLLKHLNQNERDVVVLKTIGDLKHREIAEILNIPISTSLWIYQKAIKKLKVQI
ncbi:MAG: RNA polymerase sigma factor [Candidatus Izemoplasma sp.]